MEANIVSARATIGSNVSIGTFTVVHDNVVILDNVVIGDHCIIGHPRSGSARSSPLILGPASNVRSHSVVYEGSDFSSGIETGHHVLIRENTRAGSNLRIGSFSDIEGDCVIGDYTRCHSYVHIGKGSRIGSFVWLYSLVTLTNDPLPPSDLHRPVTIEDGAIVCVGSTVLPGTILHAGAYVAAGTIVGGEIEQGAIVQGAGSAIVGHVSTLVNWESGLRHPWMNHFAHHYPADVQPRIDALKQKIQKKRMT